MNQPVMNDPKPDDDVALFVASIRPVKKRDDAAIRLRLTIAYIILGFLCAGVASWFFPPIFGSLGIVVGRRLKYRGWPRIGLAIVIVNAVAMACGIAYDLWFWIEVLGSRLPPW
jgi:hypothetical protein